MIGNRRQARSVLRHLGGILLIAALGSVPSRAESPVAHRFGASSGRNISKTAPKASTLPAPGCPNSARGWRTWRNQAIRELLATRPKLEEQNGPHLDPDQVAAQSDRQVNFIDDCTVGDDINAEVANLYNFGWTQKNGLDVYHQFDHGMIDKDYIALVRGIAALPCLLASPEFLKKISSRETYVDAAQMIDSQNGGAEVGGCKPDGTQWTTLFYRSDTLGTPDDANAFGRFLVVVPGAYDRWIQFGIWAPDETPDVHAMHINNVSVVAVPTHAAPSDGRFDVLLDWYRVYNGDSISIESRRELTGVTGNCQQCHKVSVIGIHPTNAWAVEGGKLTPLNDLKGTLANLNGMINYRSPNQSTGEIHDAISDPTRYGPVLGMEEDRMKTKPAFMRSCTAGLGLTPASVRLVAANMQCATCHSPEKIGAINFPMATQRTKALVLDDLHWPNLIYRYIKSGQMPPGDGDKLSDHEREALFNCLTLEYFDPKTQTGRFVGWLKTKSTAVRIQDASALADLSKAMQAAVSPAPLRKVPGTVRRQ